ncbi:phosphate/phosphite/phosphonate ABC transporter substrate-binding protein [Alkalicoccus chagannorensis]|uniref:phosphate/phosphite/phosphonate ABC transporter substrate-binding protein n=1 Tax=Alkalicoccus chagannorensis TaxID=427072 RepID=UPI0004264F9E|nr:phosphate/phosphite/phosphonate ABC transporter substrate-binding protein [Alkalicoccus chagannorensis]
MQKKSGLLASAAVLFLLSACGENNEDGTPVNENQDNASAENDADEGHVSDDNSSNNNNGADENENNYETNEEEQNDQEAAEERPEEITLGFVPSSDSDEIAATVEPLAEQLSDELGIDVEGTVLTNYSALVEAMGNGQVEVGFIPAFAYVLASERYDIESILKSVRDGEDSYRAQYVVRADSEFETLEDLEGAEWAFVDVASTSGYLFPATQIRNDFGMNEEEFFGSMMEAGSHDNAAITVLEGNADVATTFEDARGIIEDDYPEVFDEETGLRVLDYTEPIPNDTISVIGELDDAFVEEIREAMLAFNDDDDMIDVMYDVYEWTGITEAEDSDYDIVRDAYGEFADEVDPLD